MTEQEAREAERKAVVDWLLSKIDEMESRSSILMLSILTAQIKNGEHLKGARN